ncbi:MAG: prepilin-type N-terminal cleavage/methylation domain-containing protein [Candidatus Nealsonbacteria bacterium]
MKNKEKSFSLIEVIISVFLITTGTLGAFALIQRTVAFTSINSSRLVASYLAQEGVEVVRNIRDVNWLTKVNWDNGLSFCSMGCEADYNDSSLSSYSSRFLKISSEGFYNYDSGENTIYRRKITITSPEVDILEVLVDVEWQERGRTHTVSVLEKLYNWR